MDFTQDVKHETIANLFGVRGNARGDELSQSWCHPCGVNPAYQSPHPGIYWDAKVNVSMWQLRLAFSKVSRL